MGVRRQPAIQVGNARDECYRALAGLAVDGDLQAIRMIGDVADFEIAELARTRAHIPRDGDHRGVADVLASLNERLDMIVPVEDIA